MPEEQDHINLCLNHYFVMKLINILLNYSAQVRAEWSAGLTNHTTPGGDLCLLIRHTYFTRWEASVIQNQYLFRLAVSQRVCNELISRKQN